MAVGERERPTKREPELEEVACIESMELEAPELVPIGAKLYALPG